MNDTPALHAEPLTYQASYEKVEDDEAETGRELIEQMHKIQEIVAKDEGRAFRSVHAKTHGLMFAKLTVMGDLPPKLAQGLFAKPGTYPVAMRLSTLPGDLLDDSVSTPRGLAIKIVGVEGERLAGSEGQVTQDFVMVNGPAFSSATPKKFLMNLKLLAATTDKIQGVKKVLSATFRGLESLVEKAGGASATLKTLGGQAETHILGETFYSQVPMLFGQYMVKLAVVPVSPELTALTDAPVDMTDRPNALREEVVGHFRSAGGTWDVRVQFCTDLDKMPIEDASVIWPEEDSPYLTVARLVAEPQTTWSEARSAAVDEGMAFSPWHSLAAHRPLGGVMRVRKAAYEVGARFRAAHNRTTVVEPTALESLPD